MKRLVTFFLMVVCIHHTTVGYGQNTPTASSFFASFRTNLYAPAPDGSSALMDGTLTQYDTSYSNNVDGMDARKLSNPSEDLGMLRNNTVLIIERRHTIQGADSIFFKMWNMRPVTYKLDLVAYNLNVPGRVGLIEDKFLHSSTMLSLNDTTHVSFTVTSDPASQATDRFMVVFGSPSFGVMPITFISQKVLQLDQKVSVEWKTANESGINQYEIERSVTGIHFEKVVGLKADNNTSNSYTWTDQNPASGYNYYRIGSVSYDGKISYSPVMKLFMDAATVGMHIYPNPAAPGNLNLQMINQQAGIYQVKLINAFGQVVMTRSVYNAGGTSVENLKPGTGIPKGIYQLEITSPAGKRSVISAVF
jgi:Secretion system C-terminal sorting domain